MKNLFCLVSLIFIVSCSTPSDDQDVTNNTNNVGNVNSGNNSNNGNTNNGSDSNDNNSNNNNSNDGSDSNDNSSSNQDEISSILFEKWNFGSYSNKFGQSKDEIDFLILKSDFSYIFNIDGVESRGDFSYSDGIIDLIGNGVLTIEDFDRTRFNFQLSLDSGNQINVVAYSDSDYVDGDCTSFLECTDNRTYSILSNGAYNFLKSIYQSEFFYINFFNDTDNKWIEVANNRKLLKILGLIEIAAENNVLVDSDFLENLDFNSLTYDSILNDFDLVDDVGMGYHYNPNCERDWSIWSNRVNSFFEGQNGVYSFDQNNILEENSFRKLKFSYTSFLGIKLVEFEILINPDGTLALSYQPIENVEEFGRFTMYFKERNINSDSFISGNYCVSNDGTSPLSDINIGEYLYLVDDDFGTMTDYKYNMFTFWVTLPCYLGLCDDLFYYYGESEGSEKQLR